MPHKETIEYEGKEIEVITLDTEIHLNQSKAKILKECVSALDEDEKYQKDGKLT